MGKVTRKSDREETSKLKRKRRKKDLDNIHSKILKAKRKLDNVDKDGSKGHRQKRQGPTKICNRLLPRLFTGIYRNGAKSRNIQQGGSENVVVKARLEGNALKLFSGDTPESKCAAESSVRNKTRQFTHKEFVKNSLEWTPCTAEQSPVLGKKHGQNQKLRLVKKSEEDFLKNLNPNKVKKQNATNESKCAVQKEDICKRRLFQNDKEQFEIADTIQTHINFLNGNNASKKEKELICSEDNQSTSWNPLDRYMELCARISVENFEVDILQNYEPDPLTTTIKKLRQVYADSYRQQRARDKIKRGLLNLESPTFSVERQACTYSSDSELSPVQFEVPKCDDYHTLPIRLQEGASQKIDMFYSAQNDKFKINSDNLRCGSTSHSSRNSFAACGTSSSITENHENSDKQYVKHASNNGRFPKSLSFCFINEKKSVRAEKRESQKCVSHPLASNRYNKNDLDNVCQNMSNYVNSYDEKTKQLDAPLFSSSSAMPVHRHLSANNLRDEPSAKHVDNDMSAFFENSWKCNDGTANKCNTKNVRRVPTILRRCSNVVIAKNSCHVNGDHAKDLHERSEVNLFNKGSINGLAGKEFCEPEFSGLFENFPTPTVVNALFNKSQATKKKNSQDSEVQKRDVNLCLCESNQQNNRPFRFDEFAYPRAFVASRNADVQIEKLARQERGVARKHNFFRPDNSGGHSGDAKFSYPNVEAAKQFCQQSNDVRQNFFADDTHDQRRNIFFKSVKDRAMPNVPRDVQQIDKGPGATCAKIFNKTNVECPKSHTCGQTGGCRCDERYIYFNSADCPRKCNVSQASCHFHEKAMQVTPEPETSCETKGYIGGANNRVGTENVQILSLKQKHSPCAHPSAIDGYHRALMLQNVAQPIKYLAVKNGASIQKIPVYINDSGVGGFAESLPLKLVALMDTGAQTKTLLPREVTAQVIPLQTSWPQFNDLAARETSNRRCTNVTNVKHLDPTSPILYDPTLQSNTWYASSL